MDNEVLRAIVTGNTFRDCTENLSVTLKTISCHLKFSGKVKKMDKWVPLKLNENHKCISFEISSALLLRNQNDLLFNLIVTCDKKWMP